MTRSSRRGSSDGGWRARAAAVPFLCWIFGYYILAFIGYRFLLYGYLHETLNRQILGLKDTICLTAALILYIAILVVPSFVWSRRSYNHPVWRGIESFVCYGLVALLLGLVFDLAGEGGWSVFSGISAGGTAWARLGSLAFLFLLFVLASWWGSSTSKRGRRRKGRTATSS